MLIEEKMLAPFRGDDGLCRLKPDYSDEKKYSDYRRIFIKMAASAKPQSLPLHDNFIIASTSDYFEDVSNRLSHDVLVVLGFTNLVPILPVTRNWMAFQHQGAGYFCRQIYFIGTRVEPRSHIKKAFEEVARKYCDACHGRFEGPDTDLTTTEEYLTDIAKLGLSCGDGARTELCESIYPIDATPESLEICFENVGDLVHLTKDERTQPLILVLSENAD